MSDLDKLMQNLKKNKDEAEVKETPQETEGLKDKEIPAKFEDDDDDDDGYQDDDDDVEVAESPIKVAESPKETNGLDNTIEHEVALLQNNGIYRRELLLALKELVDVQKVNAQVMIDIKKAVTGEKNAK